MIFSFQLNDTVFCHCILCSILNLCMWGGGYIDVKRDMITFGLIKMSMIS